MFIKTLATRYSDLYWQCLYSAECSRGRIEISKNINCDKRAANKYLYSWTVYIGSTHNTHNRRTRSGSASSLYHSARKSLQVLFSCRRQPIGNMLRLLQLDQIMYALANQGE